MRDSEQEKRTPTGSVETCQKCGTDARKTWGQCFRCQRWLGCVKCNAQGQSEVYCWKCAAWGTIDGLLAHGPIMKGVKPGKPALAFEFYPSSWRFAYQASEYILQSMAPRTEAGRMAALAAFDLFKRSESLPYENEFLDALELPFAEEAA